MPRDQVRVIHGGLPHQEAGCRAHPPPTKCTISMLSPLATGTPASCRAPHDLPVVLHHDGFGREPEMRQQRRQVQAGRNRATVAVDGDLDLAHWSSHGSSIRAHGLRRIARTPDRPDRRDTPCAPVRMHLARALRRHATDRDHRRPHRHDLADERRCPAAPCPACEALGVGRSGEEDSRRPRVPRPAPRRRCAPIARPSLAGTPAAHRRRARSPSPSCTPSAADRGGDVGPRVDDECRARSARARRAARRPGPPAPGRSPSGRAGEWRRGRPGSASRRAAVEEAGECQHPRVGDACTRGRVM